LLRTFGQFESDHAVIGQGGIRAEPIASTPQCNDIALLHWQCWWRSGGSNLKIVFF
jgi:hypothetical protein